MLETGIDLVEVERIRRSLGSDRFFRRVYGEEEQAELLARRVPAASAAACFAAKEAFAKAMGLGVRGFALREVQLLHNTLGKPLLKLTGRALALAEETGCSFSVSVTHTDGLAAAVVVAYRFS